MDNRKIKQVVKDLRFLKSQLEKQLNLLTDLLEDKQQPSKYCYAISAGHGGIDPDTGKYVTYPSKFKIHDNLNLHIGNMFCEGVFNRIIAEKLIKRMDEVGLTYKRFYHDYKDWSLRYKSAQINEHHRNRQKCILFELHSNASSQGKARGFCVFTSKGQTSSDRIASELWHEVKTAFENVSGFKLLKQTYNDNDVDYEAGFWMVRNTACPAILPEFLFFDNREDVQLLMNEEIQDIYVECLLHTALWCEQNI
ncbi:MAG: N-acetylmuramoyl-L-alanine amidase [Saprospiraceae bacterium]|uniref:N-acetylmuramoyl-L-alanine amidase n=1 Tax=Kordia sp. TaxID=1965332 RepID=UPI0025BF2E62|nr:N-acetylmuramoyl-L-alanine amidase [Kordia sp.]MCH2045672.1 N-acetylmuramoyl-L-alanine amidase [Saprospiraceae bacterium]MCH2197083.1 N-acetylmuramoyl-L-alanine amidase [Kordia sp.]